MSESGVSLGEGGVLVAVGSAIGAGLLKAWEVWLKARRTPEQKAADKAGLDARSVEIAGDLMDGMRRDLDALRSEMRAMKTAHADELRLLRREQDLREGECDRRLDELAGQLRASRQEVASLIRQMRDPASTQPGGPLEGAVIELSGGDARVTSTRRTRARKST